ncbi:F-box only protein 43 [Genypterus blacodes]|uniref:F-box only protein 43 n=1 Tax=Genypterus blacodes TaxID=154954 RepID=UPI003F75E9FE
MQCTPTSDAYQKSCRAQHCYGVLSDSGYSSLFHSPQKASGIKCEPRESLSLEELKETPKENLRLSVTPKNERTKESARLSDKYVRGPKTTVGWCETPKIHKKEASLRRRLLLCKSTEDVKTVSKTSPCSSKTESSRIGSEHWLNQSFDSPHTLMLGALKLEHDVPLSGRKRRFLFSQVRTSTLEDGKHNHGILPCFESKITASDTDLNEITAVSDDLTTEAPFLSNVSAAQSNENSKTHNNGTNNLFGSTSVLDTPSSIHTPKHNRSVCEDSGFSSLTLDKSQDSSVDHDGSFQELLLSASTRSEVKRRSRLQCQHRLSTLKEGGSQSEEDNRNLNQACKDSGLMDRNHQHLHQCHSHSKDDDVFDDSLSFATQDNFTPHRATKAKPENITPLNIAPADQDITPLRTTTADLSLTPALQFVHAMCQQKAQIFANQSPSTEERLNSATAWSKTRVMFRTTMPLSGLIGRKIGLGNVDVLTELKKRNLRHILALIISHLSSEEIYRFGRVCKSWNKIILQDKEASCRRRLRQREVVAAPELGDVIHVPDAQTRLTLVKRSALKSVQAQSRTSSFCTPQLGRSNFTPLKPSSSSKREKFLEVAKTLFNDECLKPCPRCQHPARYHSVKGEGVCSRADCAFQFCTACLCAFHGSRECGSQSVGRRSNKDILLPGSAQSKRNLRRL